jgi:hypothetical protein
MAEVLLGAGRVFASHYQIVICDDLSRPLADEDNWTPEKGFAGDPSFRMVGTAADLNDHWIELYVSDQPPLFDEWQRVTCVHFRCSTGRVCVSSVVDQHASITGEIPNGNYAAYVAGQNIGVDLTSKGESVRPGDQELAVRKDLEWYRVFLVPGTPSHVGRLKDN